MKSRPIGAGMTTRPAADSATASTSPASVTGWWKATVPPPTRALADELSTHRNTVVRVYEELESAGFVSSKAPHSRSSNLRTTSAIMMPSAAHLVLNFVCRSSGTDTGNFFIFILCIGITLNTTLQFAVRILPPT